MEPPAARFAGLLRSGHGHPHAPEHELQSTRRAHGGLTRGCRLHVHAQRYEPAGDGQRPAAQAFGMKRILPSLLLAVVSLIVSLLAAELLLRALRPLPDPLLWMKAGTVVASPGTAYVP